MSLVKVTGTNYVRDVTSMAIMPVDNTEKNEYYAKLRVIKSQKEEINKIRSEIDGIKSDVSEIKGLLKQLIGKE
jgi:DNA repair exonuclease SbcCD ATPase subunit